MSVLAPAPEYSTGRPPATGGPDAELLALCERRLAQAQSGRRRFERDWELCQAFLANRQWVGWDRETRRVVDLPNPERRERFTANVVTPYVWTMKGKIMVDDFKPDVQFAVAGEQAERIANVNRQALDYAWEEEFEADEAIDEAVMEMLAFGLGGLRVLPDRMYGPVYGTAPRDENGRILFEQEARDYMADQYAQGGQVRMTDLREGRVAWEPLSAWNFQVPPGVYHERRFPWLILEGPAPISFVESVYDLDGLTAEPLRQLGVAAVADGEHAFRDGLKLEEHIMLRTMYEFPCKDYPEGREVTWASNRVAAKSDRLRYTVNGVPKAGIVMLKYHKVPRQFWPLGCVQPQIGPQRYRNEARTLHREMGRRSLGRVYILDGIVTKTETKPGSVYEQVNLRPGSNPRSDVYETQGAGVSPWIVEEIQLNDLDLDKVTGLGESSRGSAVPGVSAYSAYALMAEQDDRRVGPIIRHVRAQVAELTLTSLEAIREYWMPEKQIAVQGEQNPDGLRDLFIYNKADLPPRAYVKLGKGAPLPQSQAAMAQLITDIFDRAQSSGQPLPIDWYADSMKAGQPLPLPKREGQVQADKARYESLLLLNGIPVQPAYHDQDELHIQIHREEQSQAQLVEQLAPLVMALEQHIQDHLSSAQQKAAQVPVAGAAAPGDGVTPAPNMGAGGQNAQMGPLLSMLAGGAAQVQQG